MHLQVDAMQAYRTFVARDVNALYGKTGGHCPVCAQLACLAHVDGDVELARKVDLRHQISLFENWPTWSVSVIEIFHHSVMLITAT